MILVEYTNGTNTIEYKELQANYEYLQIKLEEKEKQLEFKDKTINKLENEIENLKSKDTKQLSTSKDKYSVDNQYMEKYRVDITGIREFFR